MDFELTRRAPIISEWRIFEGYNIIRAIAKTKCAFSSQKSDYRKSFESKLCYIHPTKNFLLSGTLKFGFMIEIFLQLSHYFCYYCNEIEITTAPTEVPITSEDVRRRAGAFSSPNLVITAVAS